MRNKKKLKNVLITSISKKVPLIKSVKRGVHKISKSIKIFGGDSDFNSIGKNFVDSFWEMPHLNNLSYKELLNYCIENNIGLIIPTRDGELEYFAKIKNKLKSSGICVMVSDASSIKYCLDKLAFGGLEKINAIPAFKNIDQLRAEKFVVKEQYGYSSKSIGINLSRSEALLHASSLEYPIFQQFISGYEISIDSYITTDNNIKGIITRKRIIVENGESVITSTFSDHNLEKILKIYILSLNLYGHINLQAIIDENNDIHIIECNARFGGASTISIKSGLDSFYWLYLESIGLSLKDYKFIKSKKQITQIRHLEDFYI